MIVGIYKLTGRIEVFSLKEKRQIIKSLMQRIQHKFHLSIAETAYQDHLGKVEMGLAIVSNNKAFIERNYEMILNYIEANGEIEIYRQDHEFIYFDN